MSYRGPHVLRAPDNDSSFLVLLEPRRIRTVRFKARRGCWRSGDEKGRARG